MKGRARAAGLAPLLAGEMLWAAEASVAFFMSWLVRPSLLFADSRLAVRGTGWPGETAGRWGGTEEQKEAGQLTHLKKDKTFVVLKIRSHIADTTFHGSGTELFRDDEWEGQRYRSAWRNTVAKSVLRVHGEQWTW